MKSFSVEILGERSSVGRQYLLKWTSEIKVVMMLYGMACVVALCVLAAKVFRVPANSNCTLLLKYTSQSRMATYVTAIRDWRSALFCHSTAAKHLHFDLLGKCWPMM
jgi:hypothetical protein